MSGGAEDCESEVDADWLTPLRANAENANHNNEVVMNSRMLV